MSKSKNHHYLSRFYLEGFSTINTYNGIPQKECYVYDIKNKTVCHKGLENIASKTNLFSVVDKDGVVDDDLEKEFSKYESELAPIIKKIKDGILKGNLYAPPQTEVEILSQLFLFQLKRSIVISRDFEDNTGKIFQKVKSDILEKFPGTNIPDDFYKNIQKETTINSLKSGFDSEFNRYKMLEEIQNRNRYFFYITDNNRSFVTSDFPIYRYNGPLQSDGFENPTTQVIFPLSSKIVRVVYGKGKNITYQKMNDMEYINRMNGMIISNATNVIIGSSEKLIKRMSEWKEEKSKKYLYLPNALFLKGT